MSRWAGGDLWPKSDDDMVIEVNCRKLERCVDVCNIHCKLYGNLIVLC